MSRAIVTQHPSSLRCDSQSGRVGSTLPLWKFHRTFQKHCTLILMEEPRGFVANHFLPFRATQPFDLSHSSPSLSRCFIFEKSPLTVKLLGQENFDFLIYPLPTWLYQERWMSNDTGNFWMPRIQSSSTLASGKRSIR